MEHAEFEYKIIEYKELVTEEMFLNEAGRYGWELCCKDGNKYYFKRSKELSKVKVWKGTPETLYATV